MAEIHMPKKRTNVLTNCSTFYKVHAVENPGYPSGKPRLDLST